MTENFMREGLAFLGAVALIIVAVVFLAYAINTLGDYFTARWMKKNKTDGYLFCKNCGHRIGE